MMDSDFSLKGIENKAQGQVAEPQASTAATLGCVIRRYQFRLGRGGFAAATEAMRILRTYP